MSVGTSYRHDPAVVTEELTVGYRLGHGRRRAVLEGLNLELHPRELVCVLGPNGCGKSSLLRTVAGLLPALGGRVLLGSTPIDAFDRNELARRLAVVLTDRIDPGFLTVLELVSLGRFPYTAWNGRLEEPDRRAVAEALAALGLSEFGERRIAELSDGEQQKAMIARAVAQRPRVLVLDEPTAYLDLPSRVEILQLLRERVTETAEAVLLSTHELELALRLADRLWLIDEHGGVECGLPEELVLNGAIGRAFARDELQFDLETASFRPTRPARGTVALVGDGIATLWTARALERVGFAVRVASSLGPPHTAEAALVEVYDDPTTPSGAAWRVRRTPAEAGADTRRVAADTHRCATLDQVLRTIETGRTGPADGSHAV